MSYLSNNLGDLSPDSQIDGVSWAVDSIRTKEDLVVVQIVPRGDVGGPGKFSFFTSRKLLSFLFVQNQFPFPASFINTCLFFFYFTSENKHDFLK